MEYSLDKYKKLIDDKEIEVSIAKENIDNERRIFKEKLNTLENDLSQKRNKLDELKNITIPVKIIDLITELSYLTNVDIKDMSINIECDFIRWGKNRNIKEFLKYIETKKHEGKHINLNLEVLLVGSKKSPAYKNHPHPFYYFFKIPFNMTEIQLDGKTLLDHCSVEKRYDDLQGEYYTKIVVDKKIDKIILNIRLGDIFRKEDELCRNPFSSSYFYPYNIFNEAVRNCVERNYEPENESSYQKKIKL
jgi:hypothetical protein